MPAATVPLTRAKTARIPARQARSQKTLDRITVAARAMLEQRSWEELTMADLAKAAGCHVGSIYARFEGKAALLDHLDELYANEIMALDYTPGIDSTAAALEHFIKVLADYHRRNAGLVRTLIIETRAFGHPAFHARSKRMNDALGATIAGYTELAKREGLSISKSQMGWAIFFALTSIREAVLYDDGVPRPSSAFRTQVREITTMVHSYLGVS